MRRRILLTIILVTTLAVTAFFVPAAIAISGRIERGELLELQREASIVASRVPPTGPILVDQVVAAVEPGDQIGFYDSSGALLLGDGPEQGDDPVTAALDGTFVEDEVGDELVAAVPLRFGATGPNLVIRLSEPRSASRDRIFRSISLLGLAALTIIALAAVIGVLLARRLSRPVEELRDWAVQLGDRSPPAPPAAGIAELDELSATLQTANGQVQSLLERERSFSSQVSHQLRTPVAAMRVAIEAELDSPRPDHEAVLRESLGALDRLESTISSLLALARHADRGREHCDVTAVVGAHVDRWAPTFTAAGRTLRTLDRTGPVVTDVDVAALGHVLDVLVDNARVHGRGTVTVSARALDDRVEVDVVDEGVPPVDVDPFSEQRADTGHGIGLRLARTLATSEGGTLTLAPAPSTTFRLTLPVRAGR